jgi:carbamoyl-phosphate synthase large subunit
VTVADVDKDDALPVVRGFADLGVRIYATSGTARYFNQQNIPAQPVRKLSEGRPNISDLIRDGRFQLVLNTVSENQKAEDEARLIRREAVEHNIPVLTSLDTANALLTAILRTGAEEAVQVTEIGDVLGAVLVA